MDNKFSIGPLTPYDIPCCLNVLKKCFADPWQEMETMLEHKGCIGLGCWKENNLVGFNLSVCVLNEAELYMIAIDPAYQKKGLALELMISLQEKLVSLKVNKMFLEVNCTNHSALHLYKKLGFELIGRRKQYYKVAPNTYEDAYQMELNLY